MLFWFLSTRLLEPLYTTHIQKQLTAQADAIVERLGKKLYRYTSEGPAAI